MSKSRLLASVALVALCVPVAALSPGMPFGAAAVQAQSASVSFQLFFDQLEPHGVWVRQARYGYVFCPTGVDAAWRPYTRGRWLYLEDRGWYFASDEPFAWATYHYGRWFADRTLGWCWVPGTKWAPAWVSWRRSDSVVGWAPLPPEGDGYAVSVQVSRRELPEGYWVFVPTERFVEPDLSVTIVIGSQQPDYYVQTEFLGPVVVEGDVVVNNVIDVTYIEQTINQQVIVYQTAPAADPAQQSVDVDAQAVVVFDQDIAEPAGDVSPPEPVEEADAAATIETEGGTAGATADLPDEDGGNAVAPLAPDAAAPADTASPEAPAADEPPAEQPATDQPAAEPVTPSAEAPAPAEGSEPAATPAPSEEQPSATADEEPAPATEPEEPLCPPETMVDGKCPPIQGETEAQPEAELPATEAEPAAEPAPAPAPDVEEAPAPETAPAEEAAPDAAPAPDAAAPEAEPAPAPAAEANEPACPPETMVDGKCPVLPAAPAQP
ncbi:DUF6600 domain-containing protein [Devosia sp. SL43]|uniref:DUF6600 domain-containing protein n=1 Tax=Devosia sp. SL43 TaxID=2806348 RepID=UPI001F354CA0|nr:DUF6600 domain-containing protein [Devosia sp. SL43]UJW86501.1 hypothetical protein IM737_04330 [Devosia sp. SL43]